MGGIYNRPDIYSKEGMETFNRKVYFANKKANELIIKKQNVFYTRNDRYMLSRSVE